MISVGEKSIINEFSSNSEVVGAEIKVKTAKSRSKNLVKPFSAKSKSIANNSGSGFLTFEVKLGYNKLL